MKLEATHLKGRRYAVKPAGQLGTCGFYPEAWIICYVNANSAAQAVLKTQDK